MDRTLFKRMSERGYNDKTIAQFIGDFRNYFGSPPDFKNAMKKVMEGKEIHLISARANKVASMLKLLPELIPSKSTYEGFLVKQTEWNGKRMEYYANRDNDVSNKLMDFDKKKATIIKQIKATKDDTMKLNLLRDLMLIQLYTELENYIGRGVEFRLMQMRKIGTSKDQNYMTRDYIYIGTYKQGGKRDESGHIQRVKSEQIVLEMPKSIRNTLNKIRKLSNDSFLFGGDKPMLQPRFSKYQKKVMGASTNELRKILAQYREGISKKKLQETAKKMGNTARVALDYYS